ncbi:MAG: tetratricopeptide repeat protein [Terracidiphilus sp.]|jgi:tetratricopeptide (TPR) repeat protein
MSTRYVSPLILLAVFFCPALRAAESWIELRSPHFTVLTDSNEKQARHIADQFERMRWVFQTMYPKVNVDPPQPIVVLAARDQKSFATLEPAAYLAKGQIKLGGLFLQAPDTNYMLLRLDAGEEHPYAAIYHEYTHLQFASVSAWLPLWLNEGFAEFMQNTEIRDKDVFVGQPNVDDILYLRQNRIIPLSVLFSVDRNSPYYHEEQKGSVFYAESWALTHYLEVTDHEKGANRLGDYFRLVSQHVDPVTAGETAFGDLKKLQTALEYYIQVGNYKQFKLSSAAAPIDESAYKVRLLTPAETDAVRADFLVDVRRTAEARTLLEGLLKQNPDNAQAHEGMGHLEQREGDLDGARKSFEQAVKLGSQSYLAHYSFAMLTMMQGGGEPDKRVEESLRAAIRLNPRYAPAYGLLAEVLAMQREKLDEARLVNLKAIELDPANVSYRVNAANILMSLDRYADAEAVLRNAIKMAKDSSDKAMVEGRLNAVAQIQAMRAQATAQAASPAGTHVAGTQVEEQVVDVVAAPKHPTELPNGSRHTAEGVIRGVTCAYPSELEFRVENPKKSISLYSNDFAKINLSVLGFTPKGSINPCKDFEGMEARVQYAESSDKTVDGQVIAVELRK